MKHFLLLVLATITLYSCSKAYTGKLATTEQKEYIEIMDYPNTPKDQLYIAVNEWFVETFVSSESVIEFSDKEAGKVMGKYVSSIRDTYVLPTKYTISVDVKDDKVRVKYYNPLISTIDLYGKPTGDFQAADRENAILKIRDEWQRSAAGLKAAVTSKLGKDW